MSWYGGSVPKNFIFTFEWCNCSLDEAAVKTKTPIIISYFQAYKTMKNWITQLERKIYWNKSGDSHQKKLEGNGKRQ